MSALVVDLIICVAVIAILLVGLPWLGVAIPAEVVAIAKIALIAYLLVKVVRYVASQRG
jgi:biotin transporter BioY